MPTKLTSFYALKPLTEQLDAARRTLKDDEGMDAEELCARFCCHERTIANILKRRGWGITVFARGRNRLFLVNPKILKQHAAKT